MNYKKLVLHFLGLVVPLFLIVELFHYVDKNNELEHLKVTDAQLVEDIGSRVRVHLSGIAADLITLSHSPLVLDYLDDPSPTSLARLQESFMVFSNAYGKYDQVRLLDQSGQERIRVNHKYGKALLVPEKELQNKAHRYYFANALRLENGSIYVSPFDLNMERGEIEIPEKPVIRLSTPVFDGKGELRGILIVNYLGRFILDEVARSDSSNRGELMMINEQGYWLYSSDKKKTWGFMTGEDERFSTLYPFAWNHLSSNEEGQFQTNEGMFTYLTFSPPDMIGQNGSSFVNEEWWKLLSVVSGSKVSINSDQRLLVLYKLSPVFLLVLGLVAWLWTKVAMEAEHGRVRIKQLSRVVEQSEELVFITDPDARIQYVNPAFERITGYKQEEVIGKMPSLLKSEAHGNAYYKRLWKTIRAGEVFKGVFVNKRKDNTLYYEEKIISPIHDELGNIIQYVSTGRDVSEQNTVDKRSVEMDRLTDRDTLTKLPNRMSIIEELKQAMQRAESSGKLMAAAMIDLDGFDWVNESYGHYKGDQLLISFAQRLQRCLKKTDGLGRLGGDEFLIIMEGFEFVDEIEHKLEIVLVTATSPFVLDGITIQVNANMGVVLHPVGNIDHKTLLIQAEDAVQRSKKEGKNMLGFHGNGNSSEEEKIEGEQST